MRETGPNPEVNMQVSLPTLRQPAILAIHDLSFESVHVANLLQYHKRKCQYGHFPLPKIIQHKYSCNYQATDASPATLQCILFCLSMSHQLLELQYHSVGNVQTDHKY
ncbi:uncharacterized protein VTP21DRAFT_9747 [Calcarisporiella thermophila]|uniref:uncharacterized protein n=1 Tax=Calcarisporiella thermophila TaxID=911321 RepID=UPI003742A23D